MKTSALKDTVSFTARLVALTLASLRSNGSISTSWLRYSALYHAPHTGDSPVFVTLKVTFNGWPPRVCTFESPSEPCRSGNSPSVITMGVRTVGVTVGSVTLGWVTLGCVTLGCVLLIGSTIFGHGVKGLWMSAKPWMKAEERNPCGIETLIVFS